MTQTIANDYKEYILRHGKIGSYDIEQTIYKFENEYRVSVMEEPESNLVRLVIVRFADEFDSRNVKQSTSVIKDILFHLTNEELNETLEAVKNL
ncbi:TPA: hypothetical protein U0D07_001752 [Listeria monocytogenes]|nr:hypothetical protein [Listeria monocytogenes]